MRDADRRRHRLRLRKRSCIQHADRRETTVAEEAANRVQFREDPGVPDYLRSRGLNPNEVAPASFTEAVRRLRAEDKFAKLRARAVRLAPSAAELVREDRDR